MRFGYWLPVFGGWLRNVDDEGMEATWEYARDLAVSAEAWGYSLTLIAELGLNDIKGVGAPCLDAWSTAAALAAVTRTQEIMVAVRPAFHPPAPFARQATSVDRISGGRLSLNVVSSWWEEESKQYGLPFDRHDRRYLRTEEWLEVVNHLWTADAPVTHRGEFYSIENAVQRPRPLSRPRPTVYAGGESEAAKDLIARTCDAYVMHGDPPERVKEKVREMRERRERLHLPPLVFGVAAYSLVRDTDADAQRELARITDVRQSAAGYANYRQWLDNTQLEAQVSLEDYSVSNRGLRSGLVGTPERVREQVAAFADAGVDLFLLQCSPQKEEMERFAAQVMPPSG